jgi:hypothetical protein
MVRGSLYVTDYRYGSPAPGYDASASPIIEYWFDVQVSNNFTDAYNVTASLFSVPSYITILDGDVAIGDVPLGNSAWSVDTFAISVDTSVHPVPLAKDFLGLEWTIEFDHLSGTHHTILGVPEIWPYSASSLPDMAPWVVPVPGAFVLGTLGLSVAGWKLRRREES